MQGNMGNDKGELLYDVTNDEDFIKQRNELISKKIKKLFRKGYMFIFGLFLGIFMAIDITFFEIIFTTNNEEYKRGLATSIALVIVGIIFGSIHFKMAFDVRKTRRVLKIYEKGIIFPWCTIIQANLGKEQFYDFKDIEKVYLNLNTNLKYITLVGNFQTETKKGIEQLKMKIIKKEEISNLNEFVGILEKKTNVTEVDWRIN